MLALLNSASRDSPQTEEHTCSWEASLHSVLSWPGLFSDRAVVAGARYMVTFDGQVWGLGPRCGSFLLAKDLTQQTFSLMLSRTSSGFTALRAELNHTTLVLYPNLKVSTQDGEGLPGASCLHVA